MADQLPISYEQIRSLVLEALRSANQVTGLYGSVAGLAAKRGLTETPITPNQNSFGPRSALTGFMDGEVNLQPKDKARVQSILWDFIIEGIVRPGLNDGLNDKWPFYHITEYGQHILNGSPPSAYDPDGYLSRLKSDIPKIDPIIVTYLTESLRTFRIGCLLSSTVTLGCASEKALLVLIEAVANALPATMGDSFRKKTESRMIKPQFEEFQRMLTGHLRGKMPKDLQDGLDVELNAIFDIIRNSRNEAGHPSGKVVERERAYANLHVFPTYLKKVYALVQWLETASL